jgi:hypothetical protein
MISGKPETRTFLGRTKPDSNNSIRSLQLQTFSTNREVCFSLKDNSNGLRTLDSCTVRAQSVSPQGFTPPTARYQFVSASLKGCQQFGRLQSHGRESLRACGEFIGIGAQSYATSKRAVRRFGRLSRSTYIILNLTCHDYSMSCLGMTAIRKPVAHDLGRRDSRSSSGDQQCLHLCV